MEECRGMGGGERVGRLESAIALRWFPVGSLGQEFPLKGGLLREPLLQGVPGDVGL
jgi:hypothetical protein